MATGHSQAVSDYFFVYILLLHIDTVIVFIYQVHYKYGSFNPEMRYYCDFFLKKVPLLLMKIAVSEDCEVQFTYEPVDQWHYSQVKSAKVVLVKSGICPMYYYNLLKAQTFLL